MKIYADVEIINLNQASVGLPKKGKSSKSILFLCKDNESTTYMMLANKKETSGTKYNIVNNIDSVFSKFLHEGKCTIRLKEPSLDFRISQTDPIQLRAFLKVLNLCYKNNVPKNITLQHVASVNISSKEFNSEPSKLLITSRLNYPIVESFPKNLTELIITGIKLTQIDTRIFSLKKLTVINLSDNCINELPNTASDWNNLRKLNSLILSANNISMLPRQLLSSHINKTLSLLDVSSNTISIFPTELWSFTNLKTLRLSKNKISTIPHGMTKESLLQMKLYIDGNLINYLPHEFIEANFDTLDISNNPLEVENQFNIPQMELEEFEVMTLMEITARMIRANNLSYTLFDVSILKPYLDFGSKCARCYKYIFESTRKNYVINIANKNSITFCGPYICLFEELICSYCYRFIKCIPCHTNIDFI